MNEICLLPSATLSHDAIVGTTKSDSLYDEGFRAVELPSPKRRRFDFRIRESNQIIYCYCSRLLSLSLEYVQSREEKITKIKEYFFFYQKIKQHIISKNCFKNACLLRKCYSILFYLLFLMKLFYFLMFVLFFIGK